MKIIRQQARDLLHTPVEDLLALDLERVRAVLVSWTRREVERTGLDGVVIGLSGGIDSALVAVIAAADLAHVGKRFGDDFDITEEVVERVESRDREDLALAYGIEPEQFYASVMKDQNERKVCGINCIYSTVKALEGRVDSGESLYYGYAPDPNGGIVSFASVAFS